MSDQIYRGFGFRARIQGAIKRTLNSPFASKDTLGVAVSQKAVAARIKELNLDNDDGLTTLAQTMATNILDSFELPIENVEALPFHTHLTGVIRAFFRNENLFSLPAALETGRAIPRSELWKAEDETKLLARTLSDFDEVMHRIALMFRAIALELQQSCPTLFEMPNGDHRGALAFSAPLSMAISDVPELVELMIQLPFAPELEDDGTTKALRDRLEFNLMAASGVHPGDTRASPRGLRLPTKSPLASSPGSVIKSYLGGTALEGLFDFAVPIHMPENVRFEHQHIVAGSGHGKTQALQHLILHDLQSVAEGGASIVVLDSQGDLIRNISGLSLFAEGGLLADRFVVIDPTDVEYPVALNLFDVGMERINSYSQLDRERMVNGVLELYDFVLGSLLDAQMTQKQSVIFRYITRLMLHIPGATITTLRELLEEGGAEKHREHISRLEGSARAFFESEFDSKEFVQTKKQVLRRLWGILENQSFERMFLHPKNKLDLFSEMNNGKVILINTAKDLLKEEGTEIFGRFFIAMIAQAAQERAIIPAHQRMPTFVYIDEAQDYFDRNIGIILSQARKYKVGMVLAHQYLGQLDSKLQEAVFANTSIKFAGGLSAKDARTLAGEMRTDASLIESVEALTFAAFIKGTTKGAVSLSINYGSMEGMPRMSVAEHVAQRNAMRERYAVHYTEAYREPEAANSDPTEDDRSKRSANTDVGHKSKGPEKRDPLSDEPADWN